LTACSGIRKTVTPWKASTPRGRRTTPPGSWSTTLVWIGFGTVIGLLAKGIRAARGAIATVLMGVGGTILGCGVVSYFTRRAVIPVSLLGCSSAPPARC
jgi:uncharacterized membrane protein YeaQ/YmgE (transglycosylase-associated protein family)